MVFSNVGTGVVEITSFYRNSPATVIGALKLALKGTKLKFPFCIDLVVMEFLLYTSC